MVATRRKKGFALLDVIVALFVVTVFMLSCCSLLIGSRRLSQQSQIQSAAYQAARQELEILRAYKYGNRLTTNSSTFSIPDSITSQFPKQSMTGTYSIQPYGALASPPLQQIVVTVSWSRLGVVHPVTSSVQLDTLRVQEPGR